MQATRFPPMLMQPAPTWASHSPTSILSTRLNRGCADGHLLKRKSLQQSCLPSWSCHLPPRGTSLRVSGNAVDGDTAGAAPSPDTQRSNLQSVLLSTSTVEADQAARITEDELSVFSKFIDEQLLQILNKKAENPVRQTVLMTDGTDTRPYRLLWPSPSLIFDVSPEAAFSATSREKIEKGLKVPRSCFLQHVSVDLGQEDWGDDFVDNMLRKGYRGDAPGVWVIEMPRAKLSELSLQGILTVASSLLMKGSTFVGVLSCPWVGSSELEIRALLRRLFVGQGFTFNVLSYEELTSNSTSKCSEVSLASAPNLPFAFIAQQERLSDTQVEYAQMQMALAEEVDEEGFEDSW